MRFFILSVLLMISAMSVADEIQLANLSQSYIDSNRQDKFKTILSRLEQRLDDYPKDHEASLLKAILYFRAGNYTQALTEINNLIKKVPDFHLAHMVKGDFILSRFGVINSIGQNRLINSIATGFSNQKKKELHFLREEAQLRLDALLNKREKYTLPRQILELGDSVDRAIVVDKSSNRLYVFARQSSSLPLKHVADFYISTGKLKGDKSFKGDLRTPEGVYFVTSWISPDKLPQKYGVGAFPVNYPNELDRKKGKTGYGIWLHGTDRGYYSRPPRDSEGCVVLTNTDLETLKSQIVPGVTPVVITESIEWLELDNWKQERKNILAAIERWRLDWESMDPKKYLSHYGDDFWSKSHNKKTWSARKKRLLKNKTYQRVVLSDISMFAYQKKKASENELVVVRFHQDYRSNNFSSDIYKRLYMKKTGDSWKIVYEGS